VIRHGDFASRNVLVDKIDDFTILRYRAARPHRWTGDGTPFTAA
jgi:hypothetical protein